MGSIFEPILGGDSVFTLVIAALVVLTVILLFTRKRGR